MIKILCISFLFFSSLANAEEKPWATVTLLQGSAVMKSGANSEPKPVTLGMKLTEGTTIKTALKSFVRLQMRDSSTLNIAASSTVILKPASAVTPAFWQLAVGSIRALIKKSQVSGEEKVIIRAGNAAIGIRGTDFAISYNSETNKTTLLTIEGKVAIANVSTGLTEEEALHSTNVVLVKSGQVSQVANAGQTPSSPQQVPSNQLQSLQKNNGNIPNFSQSGGTINIGIGQQSPGQQAPNGNDGSNHGGGQQGGGQQGGGPQAPGSSDGGSNHGGPQGDGQQAPGGQQGGGPQGGGQQGGGGSSVVNGVPGGTPTIPSPSSAGAAANTIGGSVSSGGPNGAGVGKPPPPPTNPAKPTSGSSSNGGSSQSGASTPGSAASGSGVTGSGGGNSPLPPGNNNHSPNSGGTLPKPPDTQKK